MAYLVLAVGGLTTAIGLFLVATGFPVIEIERGWATVIAGATLTAGGLVTTALGFVLQSLAALRRTIGPRPAEPVVIEPPAFTPVAAAPASLETAPAREQSPLADPFSEAAAVDMGHLEPSTSRVADMPEPVESPLAPVEAVHDVKEETGLDRHDTSPSQANAHATGDIFPKRPSFETDVESPHVARDLPLETMPTLDVSDWSKEVTAAPPAPAADAPRLDEVSAEPLLPSEPTSAVIGRYEADGTSYVMYADGSIEAQSPAGVYRFASMAELKSFIEG